jgi:hypothetical protein
MVHAHGPESPGDEGNRRGGAPAFKGGLRRKLQRRREKACRDACRRQAVFEGGRQRGGFIQGAGFTDQSDPQLAPFEKRAPQCTQLVGESV